MSDSSLRPMRPIKRVPFVEEVLPVHGHHHTPKVPHDPVRPCAGYGLDNPANAREFVRGFKQLQKEWPHLTPHQRKLRLESLSYQQLKKSGVPTIPIAALPLTGGAYAQTNMRDWQIEMPARVINTAKLPDQTAQEFAHALYHESRHAEQAYLVARRQAGIVAAQSQGRLTPTQQVQEMERQLPRGDRPLVPRSVMLEAQKQPLHKGDAQEHCARLMYDSFVGKDAGHYNRGISLDAHKHQADLAVKRQNQVVMEEEAAYHKKDQALQTFRDAFDSDFASQAHQESHLPPGLSPAERERRENQIEATHSPEYYRTRTAFAQAHAELEASLAKLKRADAYNARENKILSTEHLLYLNLPPESDAWDCGSTVTALWDEH